MYIQSEIEELNTFENNSKCKNKSKKKQYFFFFLKNRENLSNKKNFTNP